jgi:hypothetical protein
MRWLSFKKKRRGQRGKDGMNEDEGRRYEEDTKKIRER